MQYINDVVRLNIRIRRTIKQLSSRQMADLLEMTAGGYFHLETGKNCYSVYHIWLLSQAWDIDPGEFFKPPIHP
jgi:transcriptional regulator with XRE-family HTH domain